VLTHARFSVIPPEVLMDRRRKVREGVVLPKGSVEMPDKGRLRTWPGLIASVLFHLTFFAAATGLLATGGKTEDTPTGPAEDSGREVSMVYLEPPPVAPAPTPEVQEAPQTPPPQPEITTPPSQAELPPPGPETDQLISPAPAPETDPATLDLATADDPAEAETEAREGADNETNAISTDRVVEDGPEELAGTVAASTAARASQEQEAKRLFGRPTTGTGNRNNALPWASDSTCIPDPRPQNLDGPVVFDSIAGQVFDRHGVPLTGAHLQVVGTSYHTFSDGGGLYTLAFDVGLVANCRVQVVRVSAPGYRGRDLYLAMGLGENNVYMER
jgi:hypothetical protein